MEDFIGLVMLMAMFLCDLGKFIFIILYFTIIYRLYYIKGPSSYGGFSDKIVDNQILSHYSKQNTSNLYDLDSYKMK